MLLFTLTTVCFDSPCYNVISVYIFLCSTDLIISCWKIDIVKKMKNNYFLCFLSYEYIDFDEEKVWKNDKNDNSGTFEKHRRKQK